MLKNNYIILLFKICLINILLLLLFWKILCIVNINENIILFKLNTLLEYIAFYLDLKVRFVVLITFILIIILINLIIIYCHNIFSLIIVIALAIFNYYINLNKNEIINEHLDLQQKMIQQIDSVISNATESEFDWSFIWEYLCSFLLLSFIIWILSRIGPNSSDFIQQRNAYAKMQKRQDASHHLNEPYDLYSINDILDIFNILFIIKIIYKMYKIYNNITNNNKMNFKWYFIKLLLLYQYLYLTLKIWLQGYWIMFIKILKYYKKN